MSLTTYSKNQNSLLEKFQLKVYSKKGAAIEKLTMFDTYCLVSSATSSSSSSLGCKGIYLAWLLASPISVLRL